MTEPDVSVVIPTRDRPAFLAQAVRSALNQRDASTEVIVVDDGSVVPAEEALRGIQDGRLTVIRLDPSRGVAAARNTGIEAARGRWVAFLDDDDLLAPGSVAAHLDTLSGRAEAQWSCVGMLHFEGAGRVVGYSAPPDAAEVAADLNWRNAVAGPSAVVVAARALADVGGFDPAFSCYADWDLWVRLAARSPLATLDRPLAGCRLHPARMSLDPRLWDRERLALQAKHGVPPEGPGAGRHASWGRAEGLAALAAGDPLRAKHEFWTLGRQQHDWRAAAYAVALTVSPRAVGAAVALRARRRVPEEWRRDAGGWLVGAGAA